MEQPEVWQENSWAKSSKLKLDEGEPTWQQVTGRPASLPQLSSGKLNLWLSQVATPDFVEDKRLGAQEIPGCFVA